MLIIRPEQMEMFSCAAQTAFVQEMLVHCNEFSPQLCTVIEEDQLRLVVHQAVNRAGNYDFTNRGSVRLYIEMVFLFGSFFDTDPQYQWAAEILTNKHIDQVHRSQQLYEKTLDYLEKVNGPDDSYILRALGKISNFVEQEQVFSVGNFIPVLQYETQCIYPEKVEYVEKQALALLFEVGIQQASAHEMQCVRSWVVISVLMFAFGHGCITDPLYPWIGCTLKDEKIQNPELRLKRLEKKALTWLHHVIAWHKQGSQQ